MTILTEFDNLLWNFFEMKGYFAKTKLYYNFLHALSYHKNMSDIECSTLPSYFSYLRTGPHFPFPQFENPLDLPGQMVVVWDERKRKVWAKQQVRLI